MLTIKRTCANKIITRVLTAGDRPFTAVLPHDADDCIVGSDIIRLEELMRQNPDSCIVYNQHPQAQAALKQLNLDPQQIVIQVRQETRGVLGLQARHFHSPADETIELVYQESA